MSPATARLRWTSAATWLGLCGFNSALVYLLIFLLPFQLYQYYTVPQPGRIWAFQNASPQLLLVGWIILFQLYYIAYRVCPLRPSRPILTIIVAFPIFATIILFPMYPVGSNDIFEQIFRGHTFAHLGVSPMEVVPNSFPDDPLLPYVFWRYSPGTYGPVWELTSALTSWLAGADLSRLLLAYKLLATAHFWASMALVWATLRLLRPEWTTRGFVLFAWNPLLQFELAGNSHLDAVLLFWMLLAVYLLVRGKYLLALLSVTMAALVKFLPVLLVPLFLVALWHHHGQRGRARSAKQPIRTAWQWLRQQWSARKHQLKHVGLALVAMGILTLLAFLPFKGPASTLAFLGVLNTYFHSSVPWLVLHTFETQGISLGESGSQGMVRILLMLFTLAIVLWHIVRVLRGGSEPGAVRAGVLRGGYEILFAWLLFASQYFNPWYTAWLFAFVPFLPHFGYAERAILFNFTALAGYFVWFYRWPVGSSVAEEAETTLVWSIFLLPFLFSVGLWLYRIYMERRQTSHTTPTPTPTETLNRLARRKETGKSEVGL